MNNVTEKIKKVAMNYLQKEFKPFETIDVSNKRYIASPLFAWDDKPVVSMFSNEVKFPKFILTYRSYSPTNHAGKLKEGYYTILYHIQPI